MFDLTNDVKKALDDTTNVYLVELEFREYCLGAQPKSEKLIRSWIETKMKREAKKAEKMGIEPPTEARKEELIKRHMDRLFAKGIDETIEEESERAWCTFFHDEYGPWIGHYAIKAGIREMLTTLGITGDPKRRGIGQTRQHLKWVMACDEEGNVYDGEQALHLHFFRDGEILEEVDGCYDSTGNVMTAQGPRSILKKNDYMVGATLRFAVGVPANMPKNRSTKLLKDEDMALVFAHGQNNGFGAMRAMGHGTFTLKRLVRVTDHPWVRKVA